MSTSKLFQPIRVGEMLLKHRVVMCPLTRFRADAQHVPLPHVKEYYRQRASVPGTLLITEGTFISAKAGGYPNVPGIWSDAQIAAWKEITDAVHANGSFMYLQLWALGRAATPSHLTSEDPSFPFVAPSAIKISADAAGPAPRPLTTAEIQEYTEWYATAAANAVHRAGFDGVEIHGANGYLVDQFLQDTSNRRADAYGGSVEGRTRFALEVVDAVVRRIGAEKTAIRLSPWGRFQGMRMEDPKPTFSHLVSQIRALHPNIAYIHAVEPREDGVPIADIPAGVSNDFIRAIWQSGGGERDRRFISAGGYTRDLGLEFADNKGDLVAYGRAFIANPDLPYRLERDIPLTVGDRAAYYGYGSLDPHGFTDYPFAEKGEDATPRL